MICNERKWNWEYFKPENFYPMRYICFVIKLCRVDVVQNMNFPGRRHDSRAKSGGHCMQRTNIMCTGWDSIARDAARF